MEDPRRQSDAADTLGDDPAPAPEFDVTAYLRRIAVDPERVAEANAETLERLQHAHVYTVPFENIAIVGAQTTADELHGPDADRDADRDAARDATDDALRDANPGPDPVEGVHLDVPHLYEKIVERELGGYCFELNGLFHVLLAELGYDVDRAAACVLDADGEVGTPANHHTNIVRLDGQALVVDVGTGTPQIRRPIPLDGTEVTDEIGVTWRVTESDRPDSQYRTEYREPTDDAWSTRYVFDTTPRDLSYFEASNDHLQSAPESPFTGRPIATIATADGYRTLSDRTLETVRFGDDPDEDYAERLTVEHTLDPDEIHAELHETFGVDYTTR